MTDRLCLYCRRYPATRLAVPYSGERYFCTAACAVQWAVRELDREPRDREAVRTENGTAVGGRT